MIESLLYIVGYVLFIGTLWLIGYAIGKGQYKAYNDGVIDTLQAVKHMNLDLTVMVSQDGVTKEMNYSEIEEKQRFTFEEYEQ